MIFFRLLIIYILFISQALAQDSTYRVISITPSSLFIYPGSIYLPSVYYERSTTGYATFITSLHGYLSTKNGIRIELGLRKYVGTNPFRSWYVSPTASFGVHEMTHLYERELTNNTQWVTSYNPLSFFFIPFAFANLLSGDEMEYQTNVEIRYAIGAALAAGYRYGFGKQQKWMLDAGLQLGYNAAMNTCKPHISVDGKTYTIADNDADNPYRWNRSFLGNRVRGILTIGYRF